ncbi:MAG: DNA/RNA nuclease SfsA [Chromatiales bacterium]|jgi:sugar fermentation stimulation protein A
MHLPPLTDGVILRRYKRFLADVDLGGGRVVTAHCPNTGSMQGCWAPGAPVQLSRSASPTRKLPWTLERVDMGAGWVGVNTGRVNAVVGEALAGGALCGLGGYARVRREVACSLDGHPAARLDLKLEEGGAADAWVEVKNVTLLDGDRVRFPDAVSKRARRHLDLLAALVERGERGVMVFAVNRPEGNCFSPAGAIDPGYAEALHRVCAAGVEALAVRIVHTADAMVAAGGLPVDLTG